MSADESNVDPSLPLQEMTLAGMRAATEPGPAAAAWTMESRAAAEHGEQSSWQVDGSNQSIGELLYAGLWIQTSFFMALKLIGTVPTYLPYLGT